MSTIAIEIALDLAWGWFQNKAPDIIKRIVDEVLGHIYRIVSMVDEALEILWRDLAKPVLQTIFPILGRILGFPGGVLEFIFGKAFDLFKFLFGFVSVPFHEIELTIYEIVVGVVRGVYDFVRTMFVNVYNAVRSFYVGVRDVTYGFIHSTVRRIRERLHTIITVDLWILGCWKAFQGSLESFSFGDFLKTAVLCMMAPVASSYIAGIITSLTPTPGTEFPGFIPGLEFPELRVEDMPGFSVVTPPPVSFPTVGVSTLPFAPVMDLNVLYEVVGDFVLSDSVSVVLRDVWVVPKDFVLSDSVVVGLSDVWGYMYWHDLDLGDVVGLSLVDDWGYGVVSDLSLGDLVDLGLFDGWGYDVGFSYDLSDGVGLGLSDDWRSNFVFMSLGGVDVVRTDGQVVDMRFGVDVVRTDGQVVDMRFGVDVVRIDGQVVDMRFGVDVVRIDGQVVDMRFGVDVVRIDGQVVNYFRFGLEYIIS